MNFSRLVASAAETRALDQALEADSGLTPLDLMEIAGSGCFLLIRETFKSARRLVVVAGPGQNGGDGFVVARYALAAGCDVSVFTTKAPRPGPPAAQLARLEAFGARALTGDPAALERALADPEALVVDALFGTGVSFPLRDDAATSVASVARAAGPIVSIDVPSGLDADTGAAPSGCVRAAVTLTIGTVKPGLLAQEGARVSGRVELVPLPYPPRLTARLRRAGRFHE